MLVARPQFNLYLSLALPTDQDHPERVHHPGLPGQVDPDDQDHHSGAGCGVWPQPGEGGTPGPRCLLLWEHLLLPLPQVQQERGQETRGEREEIQVSVAATEKTLF